MKITKSNDNLLSEKEVKTPIASQGGSTYILNSLKGLSVGHFVYMHLHI